MKKKYFTPILCLLLLIVSHSIKSQEVPQIQKSNDVIEGLSIYPNPATGDKIYITSNLGLTKQIKIYDVLGKKILFKVLVGKELDISNLNSGVYYIEVTEHKNTESLKFVRSL